ncbi:hypothetical protein K0M31_001052 [Melipona bicolor]|uniref:Uncharacterized protein n=1 Tax=Melipona bicolor TaxID=60889 RepID=A0AA40KXU4_9HYME|nr:hypothetical protein K0M31_001052 [Melipona bicolor]
MENPWPHNPTGDFMKILHRCKRRRHNGCKGEYVRKRFSLSQVDLDLRYWLQHHLNPDPSPVDLAFKPSQTGYLTR